MMIPGNHDECARTPEIARAPGLTRFGTYNMLPEPAGEISMDTFTRRIVRGTIVGTESRQPSDLKYDTLKVFWLAPGNGVGMSRQWSNETWRSVFWLFGCEHKLVECSPTESQRDLIGDHVHVYMCEHCGYELTVDSSG